jgi:hypothetical protein
VTRPTLAIVGASLAGAKAAEADRNVALTDVVTPLAHRA